MSSAAQRLAERATRLAPFLLGAGVLVLFYGVLLVPGRGLAARDIPFLHLPLRTALRTLVASGALPTWDPWEHGGQPLLSNPHYAAFYPVTWLLLWLPPLATVHATVVLHAALAFAGAWRLARRFALGRTAAAFAAVGYCGNGAIASLPGTLLMFCGFAWLPWAWSLAAGGLGRGRPSTVLLGVVLALQILAGDPAAVLVTWLGLGALVAAPATGDAEPLGFRWRRLGGALALGVLLSGMQVVPTLARLQDSARGSDLGAESTVWSTRPLRLLELLNPRLFGDPTRDEEDLYFGAPLNDKNYPFLQSIYPGSLLASIGLASLLLAFRRRGRQGDRSPASTADGGIPESAAPLRALAFCAALGVVIGLGRFDPLYPLVRAVLPFLDRLRYPEKFLLLTLTALVFAGAAGLDRLLRSGEGARALRRIALPLAATLVALDAVAVVVSWSARPSVEGWIARAVLAPLPASALAAAGVFVRREMLLALGWAVLAAVLLAALARSSQRRRLGWAAVVLLLADLAFYGRRALPTVPAADLTAPRPPARAILASAAADQRLFSDALFQSHESTGGFRVGTPGTRQIETLLDALTPSSAATVGLRYALHRDFDLMLTSWGRLALGQVEALGPASPELPPLLAAWNVGTLVRARAPVDQVREFQRTRTRPLPVETVPVAGTLPRWRFAAGATIEPVPADAFAQAAAAGFDLTRREVLVAERDTGPAEDLTRLDAAASVLSVVDRGGSVTVHYRARAAALFVAAQTFDDGWTAATGGEALRLWPTAIGQLAVLVPPADDGTLVLRYRDPWLGVGAAVSVVTALGLLLAVSRRRRGADAAVA